MTTPERSNLVPLIDANIYFMDRIAEIEDEMDAILNHGRQIDVRIFRDLEKDFQSFSNAFDALTHGHNIPFVVGFLQNQVTELRSQAKGQEDYENIQRLSYLADDLSRAA